MKLNLLLLLKIVMTELVFYISMFVILIFLLFFIFGSGAGAESPNAYLLGTSATYIIILTPLLFNLYQIIKYRTIQPIKSVTYLIAEIVMILFVIIMYYFDYIGT